MALMGNFDIKNILDLRISKPWKVVEGGKVFVTFKEDPESKGRDVDGLRTQSGLSTLCGCHFGVPLLAVGVLPVVFWKVRGIQRGR
jgi:hypothetical protein